MFQVRCCGETKQGANSLQQQRHSIHQGSTTDDSSETVNILESVDERLCSSDAHLLLLEILHNEFQALFGWLETAAVVIWCFRDKIELNSVVSSQQQVKTLAAEKQSSKSW